MIKIQNLHKKYWSSKVLQDINLEFKSGQSVALIGPNGSGKTTLIKSILSMVIPSSGYIEVLQKNIMSSPDYKNHVGYMPQLSNYPENMKVKSLFNCVKNIHRKNIDYDWEIYHQFEIDKFKNKRFGVLSGGMKQKVSASLAFLHRPKILILDEPTAGLDPISNEILKEKVKKTVSEDRLILMTSHVLTDLDDITTDLVYLMNGRVKFYQSIEELKEQTSETSINKIILNYLKKEINHAKN